MVGCSSNRDKGDSTTDSDTVEVRKTSTGRVSSFWLGSWRRDQWQSSASLEITGIKGDSISFSLAASNGGNTGEIEGMAIVSGNSAVFSSFDESDTCLMQFELIGDSIIAIDQKGFCFAGMGVSYSGQYNNAKTRKGETTETMTSLGLFPTEKQDSIFKDLVGTSYSLFVNSTQLTSEDEDLDGLNATVRSSGVRGLFTIMENIVMVDSLNNIWAAVIDDNKVYYFTNHKDSKNTLPKTIENWRMRFKDYPVLYK
jgi:hypothetical protein